MTGAISIHIGLNRVSKGHYGSERRLLGCRNDAKAMFQIAKGAGFAARCPLLDNRATADHVRTAVQAAARELSPTGILLLTYAGHGARLREDATNSSERDPHGDDAFCLFDRMMRDDEVCGLLAELTEGQRVFLVLDCCHSAGIPQLLAKLLALAARLANFVGAKGPQPTPRLLHDGDSVHAKHSDLYDRLDVRVARPRDLKATVLMLAACARDETTPDGPEHGAFTEALLKAYEGSPPSYNELFQRVAGLHPAGTPVLAPQDERTSAFRAMRPFDTAVPPP